MSDSVSDKNKADSDRAAILRSVFQIDEDLSVYLRVSGRGLYQPESWIRRVSGSLQRILPDFEILRRQLKPRISANDLLQFDGPLKEIYEIVTPAIKRRLEDYRAKFSSSPLLSAITLFGPIELGRLETANTRALAWLMDGKQPHGFGCGVADAVIRAAFPGSPTVTSVLESVPEKVVPVGRVDVWVKGTWENERQPRWLLTIEAKIDAIESEGQLAKYQRHALKDGAEWLGIYLTLGGDDPDNKEGWKTLSFSELAAVLAAFCVSEQANGKPGNGFLKLYVSGLIKDVLGHSLPIDSAGEAPLRSASMIHNFGASSG
ncbi:MAG: PD-(D/E)XK nuclease family protein [Pseudomonadota bacterium]|nr:PD-(D/E)XK nuclease family protein [Pseudomonadota bacterium]